VFIALVLNSVVLHAQSEMLAKRIQEDLQEVDKRILNKEYDEALVKIEQLEKYSAYISIDKNRLNLNLAKAKVYLGKQESEKSINILLRGLDELNSKEESLLRGQYAAFLAKTFGSAKDYNKAIKYYNILLSNGLIRNDTIDILQSYLSIGSNYHRLEVLDSADHYYNKVIQYPVDVKTESLIAKAYNNLVSIARIGEDYQLAENYSNKIIDIKKEFKDTIGISLGYKNLGDTYYNKEEYTKAKINYLNAYKSLDSVKSERGLKIKENSLYNLSYTSAALDNYEEAYTYLDEAIALTTSISETSIRQNISEIEAKYNVAEAARKTEEANSKSLKTQVLFYGLALAFLAFLVFGYIFYNNYRLKQRNKLEQIENEMNTKIINATIDAKEKERKTIAEILHDSVSALLSSANLHLQASKAQLKKSSPKEISKAQTILNEASIKIRDLSHNLISSVLLKFGLAFAVHDMCQKYSNSEISLFSDDNGIKRYDQDFEIKIHNIIEELINNILKHSKASNATIMLAHRKDNKLSIRINDDGIGFDIGSAKKKDGLGLSHISARVKIMEGVFKIESSKDEGTSIFILVPIKLKGEVAA
jgi:signal transduction histidine kinase